MPVSVLHETLVDLLINQPPLVAQLLSEVFDVEVPSWQRIEIPSANLSDIDPVERRADALLTLVDTNAKPVLAVVIEVQLSPKLDKRYRWPVYLTTIRDRYRCPTFVLVVCTSHAVAAWSAEPIHLSRGSVITPLVLGPNQVPVITDPTQVTNHPELAVLSALAHGDRHPQWQQVLNTCCHTLQTLDPARSDRYADLLWNALSGAARHHLEELMALTTTEPLSPIFHRHWLRGNNEGKAQGQAEGEAKGKADGEAKAVLAVLAARGIDIPDDAKKRITTCTNLEQLDTWIQRAVTIDTAHDLFTD